jgi:hypothetical protein
MNAAPFTDHYPREEDGRWSPTILAEHLDENGRLTRY